MNKIDAIENALEKLIGLLGKLSIKPENDDYRAELEDRIAWLEAELEKAYGEEDGTR